MNDKQKNAMRVIFSLIREGKISEEDALTMAVAVLDVPTTNFPTTDLGPHGENKVWRYTYATT